MFMLQTIHYDNYARLNEMPRFVREGPPPPSSEAIPGSTEVCEQFTLGFAGYEHELAPLVREIASKLPEFPNFQKMLDLGSGPGIYAIAIVSSHPSMKGVIFDRAPQVKIARAFINGYEMEERIGTLVGDYNHDSIGEAYDLIWASATLYYGKHQMDLLMKKIFDALNPNGVFISFHEGLTQEQTKPGPHAILMTPMMLVGEDFCFDQGFLADLMLQAGFKSVSSRTLDTPYGPMDLDIGRKQ
jgi:predicted TPR repeat methyltransferase